MSQEPIVTVKNGSLKGCIKTDYLGKSYYSFQGIPYAKPPLGDLRFKAPQPSEPWTGIRDATKEGNACFANDLLLGSLVGSEDCLFLNVYTPQLPSNKKHLRPVMFWIHGGGFIMGSGDAEMYGPDYIITEDVVLVTINYRVGLLGFLSFDDPSLGVSGNAGLKDQVMALTWVKENISYFGGDSNNVTIFGESAGAVSCHWLICSPLASGLFHKAILQSGTATGAFRKCENKISAHAEKLGMAKAQESEIFKILQAMSAGEVLQLQENISKELADSFSISVGPVIEHVSATMPILTEDPLDVLNSGKYNHVPIMIGYTSREGLTFDMMAEMVGSSIEFETIIENSIPHDLNVSKETELHNSLCDKLKEFYYGSEKPSRENSSQYHLLSGDVSFVYPIYSALECHILTSDKPIYLYRMSIESKLNFLKQLKQMKAIGVCHGDDIGYLFKHKASPSIIPNSIEEKGLKVFTKLWTQFAKTGNPNLVDNEDLLGVTWKPVEVDSYHFADIGENFTVGVNPDQDRVTFWKSMYNQSSCKCNK